VKQNVHDSNMNMPASYWKIEVNPGTCTNSRFETMQKKKKKLHKTRKNTSTVCPLCSSWNNEFYSL